MISAMNRQELGKADANENSINTAQGLGSGAVNPYMMNTSQATNNLVGLAGANPAPATRNPTSTLPGGRLGAVWGDGLGRGFPTTRRSNNPAGSTARTGSGLLLDDSTTDSWTGGAAASTQRLHGINRQDISSAAPARSQAPADASLPNGVTSAALSSRSPAINLNGVSGHQSRPSFGANFTNQSNFGAFEQPPAVYTKSDRPPPPSFHAQSSESAVRRPGSAQPSPAEERRSWLGNAAILTHQSMPGSRNSSLPPSRDGDESQLQIGPVGRVGSDQFRRQSNPHANMPISNAALQFSQLSLDDVRGGTTLPTNGSIGSANYDAALSDTASLAHYSRRGSAQIEPSLSNLHTDTPIGTDMHPQPPFPRQRFDAAVGSQSRPLSFVSQSSSRRDSAQSREFQPSGAFGGVNYGGWGQMEPRLRGFPPDAPGFNEPRFGQYQALRHPGYPYMVNQHNGTQPGGMLPPYQQSHMYSHNTPQHRDSNESARSPLLDDYKSGGRASRKYELRDVFGHIVEFSGDQHGSRFIQAKLETASSEEKSIIFKEILSNSMQLMTDVFGNYVIQKLFEHGDQLQKRTLAMQMKGRVVSLSVQMYGCRVVQKALEHVLTDQQTSLVSELERDVMRCVKDQNGNHVIQKAIERCPSDAIRFIFDAFVGQILQLSVHAYGCRVIQRCLEFCEPKDKDAIMEELHTGMSNLIIDQFGNYVVQHVVQHGKDEDRQVVLDIVSANLEQFSKHKFASNVVEKCLSHGGVDFQKVVLERLLSGNKRHPESTVLAMIKDSYGNYVIQKLLDVLPQREYVQCIDGIQVDLNKARRSGAGKQVASIEKKMHRFPFQTNSQVRNDHQSRAVSGERTPALTFTSVQSSAISSVNGDTVDGNHSSRKNSIHG